MTNWDQYQLPAEATRIDHITLRVWKLWQETFRPTLGLALRIALAVVAILVVVFLFADASFFGPWAIAATCVILGGIVGGATVGRRSPRSAHRHSSRSGFAAALIALPFAFVLIGIGGIGASLLVSFVVVPVANYGLPALLLVTAGALAVGWLVGRWRTREANRYPHLTPQKLHR